MSSDHTPPPPVRGPEESGEHPTMRVSRSGRNAIDTSTGRVVGPVVTTTGLYRAVQKHPTTAAILVVLLLASGVTVRDMLGWVGVNVEGAGPDAVATMALEVAENARQIEEAKDDLDDLGTHVAEEIGDLKGEISQLRERSQQNHDRVIMLEAATASD